MTLEDEILQTCPASLVSTLEKLRKDTSNNRVDGLRSLSFREDGASPRCIILANHWVGDAISGDLDDGILGYHLSVYFEQITALTDADRAIIAERVSFWSPMTDARAALLLTYLNFLKVDMRTSFAQSYSVKTRWTGISFEANPSFLFILHRGLFGDPYIDDVLAGLRTIEDVNEITNYLVHVDELRPAGYRAVFEAFIGDMRMTQPDFLNPEPLDQIARQLLQRN
jgi:hypothetical protein